MKNIRTDLHAFFFSETRFVEVEPRLLRDAAPALLLTFRTTDETYYQTQNSIIQRTFR